MSTESPSPSGLCCVTMLSPGAAWQCVIRRQAFRMNMAIRLLDRYQDTAVDADRSILCRTVPMSDGKGNLQINNRFFRLRMSQDKGLRYLSGFIETVSESTMLWDIQLTPLHEEPGLRLYRAQGRFVTSQREILFPPASSFLVIEDRIECSRGIGCALNPFSAVYLSEKHAGFSLAERVYRSLPSADFRTEENGSVSCIWLENAERFCFQSSPLHSRQSFRIQLSKHHEMITSLGGWTDESLPGKHTLPGFIISVI